MMVFFFGVDIQNEATCIDSLGIRVVEIVNGFTSYIGQHIKVDNVMRIS